MALLVDGHVFGLHVKHQGCSSFWAKQLLVSSTVQKPVDSCWGENHIWGISVAESPRRVYLWCYCIKCGIFPLGRWMISGILALPLSGVSWAACLISSFRLAAVGPFLHGFGFWLSTITDQPLTIKHCQPVLAATCQPSSRIVSQY